MQHWQDITANGYQAIFDSEVGKIVVQQSGFISQEYDVLSPDGAISEHVSPSQVGNILSEYGASGVRRGDDNE